MTRMFALGSLFTPIALAISLLAACPGQEAKEEKEIVSWYECSEGGTPSEPWACGCVSTPGCPEEMVDLLACTACVETVCDWALEAECAP